MAAMMRTLLILLAVVILQSCASVTVKHEGKVPEASPGQKNTYGWLPNSVPGDDSRINNPELDKLVRATVEKQLLQRGFKAVPPEQADYLVAWFGNIVEEVKEIPVSSFYNSYGYSSLMGEKPQKTKGGKVKKVFPRGTIIIDVLDVDTKSVIWRGSATNMYTEGMSQAQIADYINTSVAKILDDLPRQR